MIATSAKRSGFRRAAGSRPIDDQWWLPGLGVRKASILTRCRFARYILCICDRFDASVRRVPCKASPVQSPVAAGTVPELLVADMKD